MKMDSHLTSFFIDYSGKLMAKTTLFLYLSHGFLLSKNDHTKTK